MHRLTWALAALLCAPLSLIATPAVAFETPAASDSAIRIAFAKALFPEDLMLAESAAQSKLGVQDALDKDELAQFTREHPGFRESFQPAANRLIDDVIRQSMPDLYDKMAAGLVGADSAQLRRITAFLGTPAGTKLDRTIATMVFEARHKTGAGPTQAAIDAAVNSSVTPAERRSAEKFLTTADGEKFKEIAERALPGIKLWVQSIQPVLDEKLSRLATSEGEKFLDPR